MLVPLSDGLLLVYAHVEEHGDHAQRLALAQLIRERLEGMMWERHLDSVTVSGTKTGYVSKLCQLQHVPTASMGEFLTRFKTHF